MLGQGQQIASLFATVGADLTGLTSGLGVARGQLTGFQSTMAGIGGSLAQTGMLMTAAVTVPIVGIGVSALKTAGGFEAASNIMAIAARQSGTPLETLRQTALAVGKDTQLIGIDAMEAADAMTTFYKTGFTTAQILGDVNTYLEEGTNLTGALRAAIDLAAASNIDLAGASDAVAIALKTFDLDASEATSVANSFVGAADSSVAEVSDLTQALYVFGPTANQFGWSLQDTNTALALLADRGILGAEAGTSLRSMMTNMMRDTPKVTEALDELNISLYEQNGEMRSLPDILGQLSEAFVGLTEQQKNYYIQTIADTYGMKAMAPLIEEGTAGWDAMAESIANAASAQQVGTERTKGLAGAVEQMKSAWQGFMITAGTPFLEKFATPAVQKMTALADVMTAMSPETMGTVVKILGGLALGGPIMMGVGGILKTLALFPAPLLAAVSAAALLGGLLLFGSDKGAEFAENLWKMDEAVLAIGGEKGLQQWITARQGIAGAQRTAAGIVSGEGTPESREAAEELFGYPAKGETWWTETGARIDMWGQEMFGSGGTDVGRVGEAIYDVFGDPRHVGIDQRETSMSAYAPARYGPEPPLSGLGPDVSGVVGATADRLFERDELRRMLGMDGGEPMPTPGLTALFGEDLSAPFVLSLSQTPEEVAALAQSVLPAEGSLRRGVILSVIPDREQIARSAAEIADAWAAAVNAKLVGLTQKARARVDDFEQLLWNEAQAVGVKG